MNEKQINRAKNAGFASIKDKEHGVTYLAKEATTFLHPYLLINVGKEAAINVIIQVTSPYKETCFNHSISLAAKEKLKFYILVDVLEEYVSRIHGQYNLIIRYSDIYTNKYKQDHAFTIKHKENGVEFRLRLDVKQMEEDNHISL